MGTKKRATAKRSTTPEMIRTFRARTGRTQAALGVSIGCGETTVNAYEKRGAPGWLRYALFAVAITDGFTGRAAASFLGFDAATLPPDNVPPIAVRAISAPSIGRSPRTRR